jgi:hypothetical protein
VRDPKVESNTFEGTETKVNQNRVTPGILSRVCVEIRGFWRGLILLWAFSSACATTVVSPGPSPEPATATPEESKGIPYDATSRRDGSAAPREDGSPFLVDADGGTQPAQDGGHEGADGALPPTLDAGVDGGAPGDGSGGLGSDEPGAEAGSDGDCEPWACWSEGGVTRVCTAEGEQLDCGAYRCTGEGRWNPDETDCSGDDS